MSFDEAIRSGLNKYVTFSGRARRSEYWFWVLFVLCVNVVSSVIGRIIGSSIVGLVLGLALFLPGLAVGIRRLHDTGRSGWWWLLAVVPFGVFFVLYWFCQDSMPADNAYGRNPKSISGPAPTFG